MLLFRSEEGLDAWCRRNATDRGAVVPVNQLQHLATLWYGHRLDADWRPRSIAESQTILDAVGLTVDFCRLA